RAAARPRRRSTRPRRRPGSTRAGAACSAAKPTSPSLFARLSELYLWRSGANTRRDVLEEEGEVDDDPGGHLGEADPVRGLGDDPRPARRPGPDLPPAAGDGPDPLGARGEPLPGDRLRGLPHDRARPGAVLGRR